MTALILGNVLGWTLAIFALGDAFMWKRTALLWKDVSGRWEAHAKERHEAYMALVMRGRE